MHSCYLLRSATDSRRSYVGYAPDVTARLDAHNGKRPGGARATQRYRPWDLAARVSGFTTERDALCFEYAWQFPRKPGLVYGRQTFPAHVLLIKHMKSGYAQLRSAAKGLDPGSNRYAWSVRVLRIMLSIEYWQSMNLLVHFFVPEEGSGGARAAARDRVLATPGKASARRASGAEASGAETKPPSAKRLRETESAVNGPAEDVIVVDSEEEVVVM